MERIVRAVVCAAAVFVFVAGAAIAQSTKSDGAKDGNVFARLGNQVVCPVTGDTFLIARDSPRTEYKGSNYFFCCPSCKPKFAADPEKFLKSQTGNAMHH